MTVKELLLVILSAAVADNLVLSGYFGFDSSVLGGSKKSFSLCLGAVIIVSTLICNLLHGVLVSMGVEYMEIMVFALVILIVCAIAVKLMGEKAPSFAMLTLNSVLLGVTLTSRSMGLVEALCYALGTAIGFWVLLEVFASLRLKLNNPNVPKAFKGMPITVLAAGIIAMAIYAF